MARYALHREQTKALGLFARVRLVRGGPQLRKGLSEAA